MKLPSENTKMWKIFHWMDHEKYTYIFRVETRGKYYPVPPQLGTWDTRHSSCSAHVQECKVCADLEVTNTL